MNIFPVSSIGGKQRLIKARAVAHRGARLRCGTDGELPLGAAHG